MSSHTPHEANQDETIARRPPMRATKARRISGLPLAAVRRRIWTEAVDLATQGDACDVHAVLSNRLKMSKRMVQLSIIAEGLRHERAAATLRNGIANLLAMARDSENATADDLSEVA